MMFSIVRWAAKAIASEPTPKPAINVEMLNPGVFSPRQHRHDNHNNLSPLKQAAAAVRLNAVHQSSQAA
jgi:hypothetical protein